MPVDKHDNKGTSLPIIHFITGKLVTNIDVVPRNLNTSLCSLFRDLLVQTNFCFFNHSDKLDAVL